MKDWDRIESSGDKFILLWHIQHMYGVAAALKMLYINCYSPKLEYKTAQRLERLKARIDRCKRHLTEATGVQLTP